MGTIACIAILALAANEVPPAVFNDLLPRPQQINITQADFALPDSPPGFILQAPDKEVAGRLDARLRESQSRLGIDRAVNIIEITPGAFGLAIFAGDAAPGPISADLPQAAAGAPTADREGYVLEIGPAGIRVAAKAEQGLFYGMMTAEQLIESARVHKLDSIPCARIADWPALEMRGYHEDYGRDQLPTVEDHKRTVRTLAQFKMNTHLWFIESDHFVYTFDPELGSSHDRFTFDELREVAEYAKDYYIEVIPVVELLAHMENTLSDPKYAHLAEKEGSGTICPTSEESFKFVQNIVNEIAPNFPGKYFHCALDESQDVGKGKSAGAIKEKGIERVYADYYTRLDDTVKANGKTMMMYADIVLNHPNVIPMLPRDIVMMYWDYVVKDDHPGLAQFVKNGFTTVSLSGMWDWANLYPMYGYSLKNMEQLAARTAEQKALGTFVSNWGDWNLGAAGANLSEVTYYGAIYCGAQGWKPEPIPMDAYSAAFAAQFFGAGPGDAGEALTLLAKSQGGTLYGNQKARRMSVSDPAEQIPAMAAASDEELQYWRNMKECSSRAHVLLKKSAPRLNADYARSHDLCARMLELAADLALQYRDTALAQKQPGFNGRAHAEKFQALKDRQWALWEEYRDVYLATNKPINIHYLITAWENSQKALEKLIANLD
jgi:hypothetical protein